jgi:hypothetical protein
LIELEVTAGEEEIGEEIQAKSLLTTAIQRTADKTNSAAKPIAAIFNIVPFLTPPSTARHHRRAGPIAAPTLMRIAKMKTPTTKTIVRIAPQRNEETTIPQATFPIQPAPGMTPTLGYTGGKNDRMWGTTQLV